MEQHRRVPRAVRASGTLMSAALASALLAACSSTPLPPWPTQSSATSTPGTVVRNTAGTPTGSARTVPAPLGTQRPGAVVPNNGAQTAPVVDTPIAARPVDAPPVVGAPDLPYGAAVAERFPAPSVRYETPGLQAGRRAFTTNAEIGDWLTDLAARTRQPTRTQVLTIGTSQRGEPLRAMVFTQAPSTDAKAMDDGQRPTILLIGQQHGDEPAGSEALLVVARELSGGLLEPLLQRINVVIVPRANPDGANADSRVTANGVDMNRDHLLLNTPEAQALAKLVSVYRPAAVIDSHEYTVVGRYLQKFNAIQRYDALLQHATTANVPEFVTKAADEWFRQPMVTALQSQNLSSEWYYTTSTQPSDLRLSMGGAQPDTGRNVNGLKNAVSLLVETRGVGMGRSDLQRRVHTQVTAISSALRSTAERSANLQQVRSFVTRDIASQACRGTVVIEAAQTPTQREIIMLDPQTGADRTVRVDWNSSLQLQNVKTRQRPCGYWLSARASTAVERLQLLGVQVMRVAEPGSVLADTYRETSRETIGSRADVRGTIAGDAPVTKVQVTPTRSAIDIPEGSYYVPLNQALANLAIAALEPDTQNSYFANHLIDDLGDVARIMTVPSLVFDDND